ncbi:MAG: EF-P lysine aminoacylase EpmA, partial [Microgenomates group bacterium]
LRQFFKSQGFTEVETPLMVPYPDPSPFNEVFEVSPVLGKRAYLTPSPEFFMKKLLAQGSGSIFQICKAFRDSPEISPLHNPEFTILEWYRVNADYTDIMTDCENLLNFILQTTPKALTPPISLALPWQRLSVKQAFQKYANVDLDEFLDLQKARQICQKKGYQVNPDSSWEQLYHQIFLNEVEPKLPKDKPLILYDYPAPLAALARLKADDPRYAERFEFYIGGLELGNGYSELTDWQEQEKRLKQDLQQRKKLGMRLFEYDKDFIQAVKNLPPCGGIAVGVDRLIMTLTGAKTISEVLPFPVKKIFSP